MKIERIHLKLYVTDNKYVYKKFNIIDKSFFIISCFKNIREIQRTLKKIGFKNIEINSTGEKYISGYNSLLKKGQSSEKPTLGIHVIGGESMLERSKNSMQSIIENRTYPFEIICNR